jgi:hypothetical protein
MEEMFRAAQKTTTFQHQASPAGPSVMLGSRRGPIMTAWEYPSATAMKFWWNETGFKRASVKIVLAPGLLQ